MNLVPKQMEIKETSILLI